MSKLQKLAEIYGYNSGAELILKEAVDSLVPAICTNEDCSYIEEYEPDCSRGWCYECEDNSMQSCLVLAGMI